MASGSEYSRYANYIKSFMQDIAGLPTSQFVHVIQAIQEKETLDLAALYTVAVSRLSSLWLIWEDYCREGSAKPVCGEIRSMVERAGRDIGVVTFFNGEIKSLIVRLFMDLSPGILVPGWVFAYSTRIGQPLARKLRELDVAEQAARLPGFVASLYTLDAVENALLDYYSSKGSEFAYAAAGYIYWEIVKPCSLLAEVFVEAFAASTRLPQLRQEVYQKVMDSLLSDDTAPPRLDYKKAIWAALEEARGALMEELKRERLLRGDGKNS